MNNNLKEKIYVSVETVMEDFDISKPKAYAIIHQLNEELKKQHPSAIVEAGKGNRYWYDEACLRQSTGRKEATYE